MQLQICIDLHKLNNSFYVKNWNKLVQFIGIKIWFTSVRKKCYFEEDFKLLLLLKFFIALAESMNPSKPRLFAATGVLDECRILASKLENVAEEMIEKKLLNPIEDAFSRQLLSVDDITKHARVGCVPQVKLLFFYLKLIIAKFPLLNENCLADKCQLLTITLLSLVLPQL